MYLLFFVKFNYFKENTKHADYLKNRLNGCYWGTTYADQKQQAKVIKTPEPSNKYSNSGLLFLGDDIFKLNLCI